MEWNIVTNYHPPRGYPAHRDNTPKAIAISQAAPQENRVQSVLVALISLTALVSLFSLVLNTL